MGHSLNILQKLLARYRWINLLFALVCAGYVLEGSQIGSKLILFLILIILSCLGFMVKSYFFGKSKSKFLRIVKPIGIFALSFFIVFIVFWISFRPFSGPGLGGSPIDHTNYDTSCIHQSDCVIHYMGGHCGDSKCINHEKIEQDKSEISKKLFFPNAHALCEKNALVVGCRCIRNKCTEIDALNPKRFDDCDFITEDYQNRATDRCLYRAAQNFKTSVNCKRIKDEEWRHDCLVDVALAQKDIFFCKNGLDLKEINQCIKSYYENSNITGTTSIEIIQWQN